MSKQVDVLGLAGFDAWLASPPEGPKWHEPTDEHEAAAMEEIAEDIDGLAEILADSAWLAEHASFLFASSESFRAEVLSAKKDWIERRAQEIADAEADSQAAEAAIDRWESRNEY